MPARSKRQFRKMFILRKQGKISEKELKNFTHDVDYGSLPDKAKKQKAIRRRKRRRS